MPQTAIVSPQIIDSTSIGRDLITAADQAAAQAIIGVTGVDTSADYTWTGDNTFEGTLTADYIEWSNVNGIHNQPNINGFHFFAFAGSNVFRASALDFIPMSNGTKALGRSDLRFSDVYSVDGDFSGTVTAPVLTSGSSLMLTAGGGSPTYFKFGSTLSWTIDSASIRPTDSVGSRDIGIYNRRIGDVMAFRFGATESFKLYNLGTENDADTEYLEIEGDASIGYYKIQPKYTGTGSALQSLRILAADGSHISLYAGGQFAYTKTGVQHLYCDNNGVRVTDLDVSGDLTVAGDINATSGIITNSDTASLVHGFAYNGSEKMRFTFNSLEPKVINMSLGSITSGQRWGKFYSVAGSFSGNLINEAGGSYKLYNLGTDGDADTEYLELSWDTNKAYLKATETGTGIARDLVIDSGSSVRVAYNGNERILFSNTEVRPVIDNYTSLGTATRQYSDVFSVDGDFSGTLTTNFIKGNNANTMYITQPISTSSIRFRFGADIQYWFLTRSEFRVVTDGAGNLGADAHRFGNVYSHDGSFSGNLVSEVGGSYKLHNLGTDGDADTEYIDIKWSSDSAYIGTQATGTGGNKNLYFQFGGQNRLLVTSSSVRTYRNFRPSDDNAYSSGESSARWSNTYSVDGDFSGTVTIGGSIDNTNANALLSVSFSGTEQYSFRSNALVPKTTAKSLGLDGARWTTGYFTDGSFSGNLVSETGSSYKLYNLGTEGDADTEYLETSSDTNVFKVHSKITGSGSLREARFGNDSVYISAASTQLNAIVAGASKFSFGSSTNRTRQSFLPSITDIYGCGSSAYRWSEVVSVDGNFSGNMTLSNLPTADPAVAGQLWNDSGTVKISAG